MNLEYHMMKHQQMKDTVMLIIDSYLSDNMKRQKDLKFILNGDQLAKEAFEKWKIVKKNCKLFYFWWILR